MSEWQEGVTGNKKQMEKKRKSRTLEFSEAGSSHGNQSNLTEIPDHSSFYRLPDFIATKPNIALTPEREKRLLKERTENIPMF